MEDRISNVRPASWSGHYHTDRALVTDKLEKAVLDLERRRITKDEGLKAQKAMDALEVTKPADGVKAEDVDFIVRHQGSPRDWNNDNNVGRRPHKWGAARMQRPRR